MQVEEVSKLAQNLRDTLDRCSKLYYTEDAPEVEDYEYDEKYADLVA
ncbi:hypothetical protein MU545_15820, partial [Enterococcus faecium]|nr:hypothetical protein [Enterococcus faecium]